MRRLLKEQGWKAVIIALTSTFFLYVLDTVAQDFIGKFVSTILLPGTGAILTRTQWPPFLTPGLLVAALGGGYLSWWIYKTKNRELKLVTKTKEEEFASMLKTKTEELASVVEIYNELLILNDLTFQSFQRMEEARKISVGELENVTKKIIESLLAAATTFFDDNIFSGALFRLDTSDNKLKIWAHDRMLQEDVDTVEFDMSPTIKPPVGMARAAYWHRKPEFGRIEKNGKGKGWWCTNDQYIPMGAPLGPGGGQHRLPLYASLICVPVLHTSHQHPLGVVAFHSKEKTTFDDPKINQIVEQIGDRIAQALLFYEFLK